MAKKQFGNALRRSSSKEKKPLDITAAENVDRQATNSINEQPKTATPKVHRTSINFPFEIYDAMLEHTFKKRITMKDYLVDLIKKDLNI